VLTGPFRFCTATHTYTVGGVVVPGIHTVLRAGGVEQGGAWFTQEARERGKAVHEASLLWDLGSPVVLREEWQPFLDAYIQFRREVPCRWRILEVPKLHRRLRYASIIDRAGTVSGRPAVVELKTGGPASFHGPQLAGADILLSPQIRIGVRRRLAVYLRADGTYQLKEYADSADYFRFMDSVKAYWAEATNARISRPVAGAHSTEWVEAK
jgi:hypothetical protein